MGMHQTQDQRRKEHSKGQGVEDLCGRHGRSVSGPHASRVKVGFPDVVPG